MNDASSSASRLALVPGLILGNKYQLEAEIGRGAMGTVWRAHHVSLAQRVAIKVISPEHAHSEELRQRFETEAKAAAKLSSRHVVSVYDHGQTPAGLPYIVMEFLDGECLEDTISRQGSLSLADTARILRHVARGLARAHSKGIVHRDLKPANIFLTRSDEEETGDWIAKVLDFGIAKMDDFGDRSTTKTGTVLGTPLFMSPEQVRGASSVDSRADLYSLGMVVYNMLTGTFAFEGQSFGDLLVSICTEPLPVLSHKAPKAPPELDHWFQKACARDPDARYQTADELLTAFSAAIGDVQPASRLSLFNANATQPTAQLAQTFTADSNAEAPAAPRSDLASASPSTLTIDLALPRNRFPVMPLAALGALVVALVVTVFIKVSGTEAPAQPIAAVAATVPMPPTTPAAAQLASSADAANAAAAPEPNVPASVPSTTVKSRTTGKKPAATPKSTSPTAAPAPVKSTTKPSGPVDVGF